MEYGAVWHVVRSFSMRSMAPSQALPIASASLLGAHRVSPSAFSILPRLFVIACYLVFCCCIQLTAFYPGRCITPSHRPNQNAPPAVITLFFLPPLHPRSDGPLKNRSIIPIHRVFGLNYWTICSRLYTHLSTSQPTHTTDTMAQKTTLQEFESVFPKLEKTLLDHAASFKLPPAYLEWYKQSLEINAIGGKCNRGMSVPDSVSVLLDRGLSEDEYFKAATLGWMTELLQAFFLVSDDIMDTSITRRGKPCWYRHEGVGMIAINDAFMLESAIYTLLRTYFKEHPSYVALMELFHDVTFQTEIGQLADLLTAPEDKVNLDNFSMSKYQFIVVYKTAYYSFYLPVALALHQLELGTPENLKTAESILIPMGEYFQIQDDYLDNFGLPEHIGKIGTDIMDNKCSWLVNQALAIVTPEQRKVLEENYGRKDKAAEAEVKKLFNELKLEQLYLDYEEKVVGEIRAHIAQIDESKGLKKGVFEAFLAKIYKRSK
ncbi:farnesyl pyrophosphate synthetase [Ophiostoma piceae UAMH 11346]|uniref:Farnesyl pyrophosphate synthetase n=1 Tax=Ophiostoma piceae (strain UAMH 11346) TaxID=1262450 RepID=S3BVU7_OPHP1|nr:farnesyl pyrophosphate synthetase [Ophiostoma piceae UAMH 11346]